MSSFFVSNLKITIFGESHNEYIGFSIDGIKPGVKIDDERIKKDLKLRHSISDISTKRIDSDDYKFISGVFNGYTTGDIITAIVPNNNVHSEDYDGALARPGQADYTNHMRSQSFNDYRGGGHSSGRLTLCLVIIGSILKSILEEKNIYVYSHIKQVKDFIDDDYDITSLKEVNKDVFPVINQEIKNKMIEEIEKAKDNNDSLGGIVETVITGLKVGYGDPFFDSLESAIARLVFSVPAVKGIEFGLGFDYVNHYASEVNDPIRMNDNKVITITNNNGGINGGISNGMDINFKTVVKPCASISKVQDTINLNSFENSQIQIKGRHDSFIADRARLAIDACATIAIYDALMTRNAREI